MNSCLYECRVMHARLHPRAHRFVYRLFLFAIDLDELPELHRRLPPFSLERPNLYSFRDRDYLPTDEPLHPSSPPAPAVCHIMDDKRSDLKARVIAFLATRGIDLAGGRVLLVTLPRILGHLFNPVSFYFCSDRTGRPLAALAEVTNTFREVKPYFVPHDPSSDARADAVSSFRIRTLKHFYVSPFSDVDVAFDFHLRSPGEQLSVRIDDYAGATRTLTSTLAGPRRELTSARLAWFAVKYPLLSLRVVALIHWHAVRLWLKRVPWFPKAARPADQRDLHRPHRSLVSSIP